MSPVNGTSKEEWIKYEITEQQEPVVEPCDRETKSYMDVNVGSGASGLLSHQNKRLAL